MWILLFFSWDTKDQFICYTYWLANFYFILTLNKLLYIPFRHENDSMFYYINYLYSIYYRFKHFISLKRRKSVNLFEGVKKKKKFKVLMYAVVNLVISYFWMKGDTEWAHLIYWAQTLMCDDFLTTISKVRLNFPNKKLCVRNITSLTFFLKIDFICQRV